MHARWDQGRIGHAACVAFSLLLLVATGMRECRAQDMEPRSYSPNPTGVQFLALAYSRSTGDVGIDPSLPLQNVEAQLNTGVLGYGRTFGLFGRSASAAVGVPYVWGKVSGDIGEDRREIRRSGIGDVGLRLSMNLIGGPAMTPGEFSQRRPQPTLGVSVSVSAPVGQYDPQKLVNIGSNRWAIKPEIGLSLPFQHWYVDTYAGVWFFTANDDFLGGGRREQDPIAGIQSHIVYQVRPRLWMAFDATAYSGGRTTVNGKRNADLQSNTRVGLTLSVPAGGGQSLKVTWTDGLTARIGAQFQTIGIAWQYSWLE